jgi:biopolymer transport protein ExbD
MSKFVSNKKNAQPGISTASLPDIVFMLLFFFMVTTHMRDKDQLVQVSLPDATEITKMENKAMVDFIFVGAPLDKRFGTAPRIQLDDSFATIEDIKAFKEKAKETRDEAEWPLISTSMKVDRDVKMGLVTDIKQELRKIGALKIVYSTNQGSN